MVFLELRRHCGFSHEARWGTQGASCVVVGKSVFLLVARGARPCSGVMVGESGTQPFGDPSCLCAEIVSSWGLKSHPGCRVLPHTPSRLISDYQPLYQHLSTTLSAPVSRLNSACQPLHQCLSAAGSLPSQLRDQCLLICESASKQPRDHSL